MNLRSGGWPMQSDVGDVAEVMLTPGRPSRRRRWFGVVALGAAVLSLLAVLTVSGIRPARGPADSLADIVAFTDAVGAVHIESVVTVTEASDVGLGSTTTTNWRSRADVRLPADAHVILETGDRVYETIFLGDAAYERSAAAEVNLYRSPWATRPREVAATADGVALEPGASQAGAWALLSHGVGFGDDLRRFRGVLASMKEPSRISERVIRVEMPIDEFLTAYLDDSELDDEVWAEARRFEGVVTLDLTSGPSGRLDRSVMRVDGRARPDGARPRPWWESTSDVRFTKWGEPIDIAAPELDVEFSAGFVDEASILNASFAVLAPKTVPPDLRLMEGTFFAPVERGLVEEGCGKVTLYYANPEEEQWSQETGYTNLRFLNLDITSIGCHSDDSRTQDAYMEKRASAPQPYSVGPYQGTIARYDTINTGKGAYIVLSVGDIEVFADSTLTNDETTEALRELVFFDPATQPIWRAPGG